MKSFVSKLKNKLKKNEPVYIPVVQSALLKGRRALITGGGSGIGLAIAECFILSGASVVIAGRSLEKLDNAKAQLAERCGCDQNDIEVLRLDISDTQEAEETILSFSANDSRDIDILVNNAGISCEGLFGAIRSEDFDRVMETNLKGSYFLAQTMSTYMRERGIAGNILMISSSSSVRPAVHPYQITKWGTLGMTLGLAKTLIPYGIVVNGIAPGPTATGMQGKEYGTDLKKNNSPSGRYVDPIEIGNLAVFLAGPTGRMIVGETVFITGGSGTLTLDDIPYAMA